MIIDLPKSTKAKLIGDPHIGLKFEVGVPMHRRGERERSQFAKLVAALNTEGVEYNITVGDLFEHPFVSHSVVVRTAEAYLHAADTHPNTTYVVLAGNHDRPRTVGTLCAWESFREIVVDRLDNLFVIETPEVWDDFVFFPWEWDVGAEEQALRLIEEFIPAEYPEYRIAVGHWDLKSFGGHDEHLCPTKILKKGFGVGGIYSGHYHTPGEYVVDGVAVYCTGSLEPYSHGEDPGAEIYVTAPLKEVQANPERFTDKCVRVILAPGEEVPIDLDCLAVTALRTQGESIEVPEIQMDGFDWDKVLKNELAQVDDAEVVAFIKDRL